MRTVSVRLERLNREPTLGIWGVRKGEEEEAVVAAVKIAGGRIDPKRVRGGDGEIVVRSDSDPSSLQKMIVYTVKAVLPRVRVCGKAKNGDSRATKPS